MDYETVKNDIRIMLLRTYDRITELEFSVEKMKTISSIMGENFFVHNYDYKQNRNKQAESLILDRYKTTQVLYEVCGDCIDDLQKRIKDILSIVDVLHDRVNRKQ